MTRFERKSLGLVALALLTTGCWTTFTPPDGFEATDSLKARSRIVGFAAYHDEPEQLVGRVISIKKKDGECPTGKTYDVLSMSRQQYINPDAKLKLKPNVKVVYERRIEGNVDGSLTFPFVSASGNTEGAVELVVTDVGRVAGAKALDENALDRIEKSDWPDDVCLRLVIENVVTSVALYKNYTKTTTRAEVVGTAFGISNKTFNANSEFKPEMLLYVDAVPLVPKSKYPPKQVFALKKDSATEEMPKLERSTEYATQALAIDKYRDERTADETDDKELENMLDKLHRANAPQPEKLQVLLRASAGGIVEEDLF